MSYRWPFLDFVNARDSREFAERCVGTLLGKTLIEQLKERKVYELKQVPAFSSGMLGISEGPPRGFFIFLDCGNKTFPGPTPRRRCLRFAHELGHTFGFDLATLDRLPHMHDADFAKCGEGDQNITALEEFADDFSYIWMSYVTHRTELEEFLNKHTDEFVDLRPLLLT